MKFIPLLGSVVRVLRHTDESLVGKYGRVTAVVTNTVSIQIPNKARPESTRQVPIADIEIVKEHESDS